MSFVCVDIGASSTRYINSGGSVGVLPNNIEIIEKTVNGERVPNMDPVMCQIDSLELQDNLEIIIENGPVDCIFIRSGRIDPCRDLADGIRIRRQSEIIDDKGS